MTCSPRDRPLYEQDISLHLSRHSARRSHGEQGSRSPFPTTLDSCRRCCGGRGLAPSSMPPRWAASSILQAYRRSLAALLLAEPDLEVVFIWSPTYLLSLLDFVSAERDAYPRGLRTRLHRHSDGPARPAAPHPESASSPATRPDPVAATLAGSAGDFLLGRCVGRELRRALARMFPAAFTPAPRTARDRAAITLPLWNAPDRCPASTVCSSSSSAPTGPSRWRMSWRMPPGMRHREPARWTAAVPDARSRDRQRASSRPAVPSVCGTRQPGG
jgi:hypothetical protein